MTVDPETVEVLNLGPIEVARSAEDAVSEGNEAVVSLPKGKLDISITLDGQVYRCVRGATDQKDEINFPIRIIDSGRFFQRADILGLEFEDERGNRLPLKSRVEIAAWPDRLTLVWEATPEIELREADLRLHLDEEGEEESIKTWAAGEKRSLCVTWFPGDPQISGCKPDVAVSVHSDDAGIERVQFDESLGAYSVRLPRRDWQVAEDLDRLERVDFAIENPLAEEQVVRLLFFKDYPFAGITGMCPLIRDEEGHPTGIPVQISKNWHRRPERSFLHEGPWFHGFTLLRLPPQSRVRCEFAIAYARWGGVPAASHAQLCLIGWGTNQLWDQAAIGSFGESICYDPDVNLSRSVIDDIRPLMVTSMGKGREKWSWTNNVGGGDFLAYFDREGKKQYLSRMRTYYRSYGPNLTSVIYSGVSADGKIAAKIGVSSPRCDDVNRAYHHFRYDVLEPAVFSRLAFYQLGADNYNDHQFGKMAQGDEDGLVEEWTPEKGGRVYRHDAILLSGDAPWFSLHEGVHSGKTGGSWANRGIVIRSWRARLGGKEVPFPTAAVFGTENGVPSNNVELAPPAGVTELLPDDFVEADVELLVLPMSAEDYYGPNEGLRDHLLSQGNTWRPVFRQARANRLSLEVDRGTLLRSYPPTIAVDGDKGVELKITGGLGFIPITFSGLDRYRDFELRKVVDGKETTIDQSVHGNDFWQTDYDPTLGEWSVTYNVDLDNPGNERRTVRLLFGRRE
jgi:hypothetical protein